MTQLSADIALMLHRMNWNGRRSSVRVRIGRGLNVRRTAKSSALVCGGAFVLGSAFFANASAPRREHGFEW